jgi:hypothetical protein
MLYLKKEALMRKISLFIITLFSILNINSQTIISPGLNPDIFLGTNPLDQKFENSGYSEEEIHKILEKRYITQAYNPAYIDDFKQDAYLRYNAFDDQMEFVKKETTYYLKKELGRTVNFASLNQLYKVYSISGDLSFFLVHTEGKSSLLAKQSVRFIEAKKATTTYGKDKPASYKRISDELYLALNNTTLVKLPTKKKEFYKTFGSKASEIKSYMKKNKLSYKKVEDLKKVVAHFNTF